MSASIIPTIRGYLSGDDAHQTAGIATITELIAANNPIVRLEQSWFYPQGGGQPSDQGTIGSSTVTHVVYDKDTGVVDHHVNTLDGLVVGEQYPFVIDEILRRRHSALHTAGHLIAAVVNCSHSALTATLGHHWPGESRVEFEGDLELLSANDIPHINSQLADAVRLDLPIKIVSSPDPLSREIEIQGFAPIPCGGTHVRSLAEIGAIVVTGIKKVKQRLRVSYTVN